MIELTEIEKEKVLACIECIIKKLSMDIIKISSSETLDALTQNELICKLEDEKEFYIQLTNKLKLYFEQD